MSSDSDHRRSRSSERKQSEKRERRDKRSSASAAAAYPVEKPPWLTLALDSVGSDVERRLSTRLDSISSDLREVKSDQTVIKQEVQRQGVSLQGLQLRQDQADSGDVPQVTSGKPLKTIAFLIKTPIELR